MTIKDYDSEYGIYHLGIPNKEIQMAIQRLIKIVENQ